MIKFKKMKKLNDYENELLEKAKNLYMFDNWKYIKFYWIFETLDELLKDLGIHTPEEATKMFDNMKEYHLNCDGYVYDLDINDYIRETPLQEFKKELNDLAEDIEKDYKNLIIEQSRKLSEETRKLNEI